MGTTNKTEFVQGYYVKYGDGGVDVEPLIDLFKTQIFQLAEYLGVPKEIIKRKPSPDTWSLEVSDEEFFYRIPFHLFDVFWYHRENNLDVKIISEIFNLTDIETKRILNDQERKWNYSKHLRNLPPSWKSNAITKSKLQISLTENIQPLVSVIVLNFNAKEFLVNCIDSIFDSNYQNFEVILVDNASNDQTYQICKEKHSRINLIINEKNLGYCGGNNVGIKKAKGEFIIILNPDTVVEPNWITEFLKSYKQFGDAIYQPKFLSMDDHNMLLSSGQMINLFGFGF